MNDKIDPVQSVGKSPSQCEWSRIAIRVNPDDRFHKELLTARLEQSGSPLRMALLLVFGAILPLLVPLAYGAGARR